MRGLTMAQSRLGICGAVALVAACLPISAAKADDNQLFVEDNCLSGVCLAPYPSEAFFPFTVSTSGVPTTGIATITSRSGLYASTSLTVKPTPLPAALPLFAGGLAVFGLVSLLGWRRKRRA